MTKTIIKPWSSRLLFPNMDTAAIYEGIHNRVSKGANRACIPPPYTAAEAPLLYALRAFTVYAHVFTLFQYPRLWCLRKFSDLPAFKLTD